MARIFNIYFNYDNVTYHAVVSVHSTALYTEYSINNINEDLLATLPGNKIISLSPEHFVFQNAQRHHSIMLMDAIIVAVKDHVHTQA
jgi:hypothetical protein